MYFLNACENPDILRILYFGLRILDIVFIIVPIGLIAMITIDLVKIVITNEEKAVKDGHKHIINRIIFAATLFFVPTIVSVVMNLVNSNDYDSCLTNAKDKEIINTLQRKKDAQKAKEKEQNIINNNNNDNSSNSNLSSGNLYKDLANEMVRVASNEIGTKEGENNYNKYGKALGQNNVAWCAIFVTWVAKNTTVNGTNLYKDVIKEVESYASTSKNVWHFHTRENLEFYPAQQYGGTYTPKAGDYIFFDFKNVWNKKKNFSSIKSASEHTGMVVSVENGKVYTIEGNTGSGMVKKKSYNLSSTDILGYGSWYKK